MLLFVRLVPFISTGRIHFSIHYPDLNVDSRKQIWQTFFAKTLRNPNDITPEDFDRLANIPMNGRQVRLPFVPLLVADKYSQIKNVVSSAQCVALDSNAALCIEHIDAVLDVVDDWHAATERGNALAQKW